MKREILHCGHKQTCKFHLTVLVALPLKVRKSCGHFMHAKWTGQSGSSSLIIINQQLSTDVIIAVRCTFSRGCGRDGYKNADDCRLDYKRIIAAMPVDDR